MMMPTSRRVLRSSGFSGRLMGITSIRGPVAAQAQGRRIVHVPTGTSSRFTCPNTFDAPQRTHSLRRNTFKVRGDMFLLLSPKSGPARPLPL
jgi:hypothetical protein